MKVLIGVDPHKASVAVAVGRLGTVAGRRPLHPFDGADVVEVQAA